MVRLAQLVRASDCGSEGRGFDPHTSPSKGDVFDISFFHTHIAAAPEFRAADCTGGHNGSPHSNTSIDSYRICRRSEQVSDGDAGTGGVSL